MDGELALIDWEVAATPAGSVLTPADLEPTLEWTPMRCPGTAAGAWRSAGLWTDGGPELDFDALDWWFRASFASADPGIAGILRFEGIATIADVWLDGEHALHCEDMFLANDVAVVPADRHEVIVACRSLSIWLSVRRRRGRWKTRLVQSQQLRWARTTLLGRMPTWPPRAAAVGPWRPVIYRSDGASFGDVELVCRLIESVGTVEVVVRKIRGSDVVGARLLVGDASADLDVQPEEDGRSRVSGSLRIDDPPRWWPSSHGEPAMHDAFVVIERTGSPPETIPVGRAAFRSIEVDRSDDGFRIVVNGELIFCRGACWVPIDPIGLSAEREEIEHALRMVRDAGMNMVRVTGTMVYEQDEFYDLCDELGILVWQDLMFANMDYPIDDEAFAAMVTAEIEQFLRRSLAHPCIAVICGGSEVEQQAAMMGIDQAELDHPLGDTLLAGLVGASPVPIAYVPSSPSGGVFPFSIASGVSHYYGVGAYRRPLDDARRAGVRFTTECLAFANVPARESMEPLIDGAGSAQPAWRCGVPRDPGSGWDFADVRDHYVGELFAVDPVDVRYADADRYLDLGRAAVAIVIETTLAEWRRSGSSCHGALIFTLRDLAPGSGWGIVDVHGRPKSAYYAAARAWAPVAVSVTDEGLDGLAAHLFNDRPAPFAGTLTARLFDGGGTEIDQRSLAVALDPHHARTLSVDGLFAGFRDLTDAYRFGPRVIDVVAIELRDGSGAVVSESFFEPGGHARERAKDIGLRASAHRVDHDTMTVSLTTEGFAQMVSVEAAGHLADTNWFNIAPGEARSVVLRAVAGTSAAAAHRISVRALNSRNVISVAVDG
jgi:beta-mannosidase